MTEERFEREEFGRVSLGRRAFIKKLVVGAAFAVPVVASWELVSSTMASGGGFNPNSGGTAGSGGETTTTTSTNNNTNGGPVTPKNKKTKPQKNKP